MAIIVKKRWLEARRGGLIEWMREGYYLFGFIPLYVRDLQPRERRAR